MLASGRTCTGRMRKEGDPPGAEPNQTSRAALLVPGPALRHLWRPSVAGRQRLKCVRTDPAFSRDGRDRRPGAGGRAFPRRAPTGGGPWSDRCERSAQHRVNRAPLARPPATDPQRREPPRRESPRRQSRCRPALERLRKRPSRTGRGKARIGAWSLSRTFFWQADSGGGVLPRETGEGDRRRRWRGQAHAPRLGLPPPPRFAWSPSPASRVRISTMQRRRCRRSSTSAPACPPRWRSASRRLSACRWTR